MRERAAPVGVVLVLSVVALAAAWQHGPAPPTDEAWASLSAHPPAAATPTASTEAQSAAATALTGRIMDAAGRPIQAWVHWAPTDPRAPYDNLATVVSLRDEGVWSDAHGRFELELPASAYVRAEAPGYYAAVVPVGSEIVLQPHGAGTVVAHRGGAAAAPENTLAAIDKARSWNVDRIEIDLQMTRDGVLVLMHDWTLERTTNGNGPVTLATWDELRQLDAGAWFADGFAGEPVPRFEQVLALLNDTEVDLLVELKSDLHADAAMLVEARRVMSLVGWDHNRTVFASFGPISNIACWGMGLDGCAWIMRKDVDERESVRRSPMEVVLSPVRHTDAGFVESMHALNRTVYAYTANRMSTLEAMWASGADGIVTDRPDRAIDALLAVRGATSSA